MPRAQPRFLSRRRGYDASVTPGDSVRDVAPRGTPALRQGAHQPAPVRGPRRDSLFPPPHANRLPVRGPANVGAPARVAHPVPPVRQTQRAQKRRRRVHGGRITLEVHAVQSNDTVRRAHGHRPRRRRGRQSRAGGVAVAEPPIQPKPLRHVRVRISRLLGITTAYPQKCAPPRGHHRDGGSHLVRVVHPGHRAGPSVLRVFDRVFTVLVVTAVHGARIPAAQHVHAVAAIIAAVPRALHDVSGGRAQEHHAVVAGDG